ncbi:RidA family protein [Brevundimonas viscosa]|uniref:Enamine deaminase RidA, house cleaning of reactive enamine intermediates, YjgF/YER057c/UK114 family n=1 Tax=Brevundimonas viscosa TaxID=871741 RepID=A0A1I6Q9Z1_9CAUL|nr:RidA family protein [Brevundimonas viscosa]SFS49291.1 Enamine deaminase RidA, house cleaning of reactive enamine intermediates, YjgF/YER057c/UK114 family [Brevundimonas viscosa]
MNRVLLPDGWPRPRGYSNGIAAGGRMVFVAGQIGWTPQGVFPQGFAAQFRQTLENTLAVLAEGGAGPEDIVRMTWFVVDREEYLASLREVGAAWRELIGPHYPAMAVVEVKGLIEAEARLEIETTAVIG